MKIGIDIDEVVAEFVKQYLKVHNAKEGTELSSEDVYTYDLWDPLEITRERAIEITNEIYDHEDLLENLSVVEGAIEAINKLNESHELFFITARHARVGEKTKRFFKKHFPENDFKIIHTGDFFKEQGKSKGEICQELGIEVLIEDNLEWATKYSKENIKIILLAKPWNKDFVEQENFLRIGSWGEILKEIENAKIF